MKLCVLQDDSHTKEDKERRIDQIDIQHAKESMKHDLEY